MRHVVVASHHRFAQGLVDTLRFLGCKSDLTPICAYVDDTPLADQVAEVFAGFDPEDEVLVLTDIMQGSVNQAFYPYMGPHVFLVAGVNAMLAFELCLKPEPLTCEAIQESIDAAPGSICLINTFQADTDEDDE